jgi:hypothetical protein
MLLEMEATLITAFSVAAGMLLACTGVARHRRPHP